jgi:hypothetical protein
MKDSRNYIMQGMMAVLTMFAMTMVPWICWKAKIADKTYDQNLRMERKIDTQAFDIRLIKKKMQIDSIRGVRTERKVDSLSK